MSGFGIIIVDDEQPALYTPLTKTEGKVEECFKGAKYLGASAIALATLTIGLY